MGAQRGVEGCTKSGGGGARGFSRNVRRQAGGCKRLRPSTSRRRPRSAHRARPDPFLQKKNCQDGASHEWLTAHRWAPPARPVAAGDSGGLRPPGGQRGLALTRVPATTTAGRAATSAAVATSFGDGGGGRVRAASGGDRCGGGSRWRRCYGDRRRWSARAASPESAAPHLDTHGRAARQHGDQDPSPSIPHQSL